jgi:CubicO group peptidase (beta-lactamase class C family)
VNGLFSGAFGAIKRVIYGLLAIFLVLVVGLSLFLKAVHYPSLIGSIKLGLAPASKTPDLMPAHTIAASSQPIAIPKGAPLNATSIGNVNWLGKTIDWNSFLDQSYTNAFLIIKDGKLRYEYYRNGFSATRRLPSYSVGKSMTSILIGDLIASGKIKESDTFVSYFPEYKTGTAFDQITIQELLDMQGGIGVSDNYPNGIAGWGVGIAQMYATTDMHWWLSHNRKMAFTPGSKAIYHSVDPQLLGMIIKKVTGTSVSDYFAREVWQRVGAENPATWNVDNQNGIEKTFCCFNATARDYAKVGLLLLNGGKVGNQQVLNSAWVHRMSTPVEQLEGEGYGALTWHPTADTSMMDGLHGQYVYINPANKVVIVKLSDVPTDKNWGLATAAVFAQVAARA